MQNCGTCRAFRRTQGTQGECHFGPPTAMVVGMAAPQVPKGVMLQGMHQMPPQPIFAGVWPPVQEHLGCLMWQPAEAAIEPKGHEPFSPEWWEEVKREQAARTGSLSSLGLAGGVAERERWEAHRQGLAKQHVAVDVELEIAKGAEAFREPRDVQADPNWCDECQNSPCKGHPAPGAVND
jgi:hypothetical protein